MWVHEGLWPRVMAGESGVQKATSITAMMTTDPNGIPEGEEVETMSTGNDIPTYTGATIRRSDKPLHTVLFSKYVRESRVYVAIGF